jgi:hypothetical protein
MTLEKQNSGGQKRAFARKQHSKHMSALTDIHITLKELLELVFSVRSKPKAGAMVKLV